MKRPTTEELKSMTDEERSEEVNKLFGHIEYLRVKGTRDFHAMGRKFAGKNGYKPKFDKELNF